MRKILAISILFSSPVLWAQGRPTGPLQPFPAEPNTTQRLQQEAFEKWALDTTDAQKQATAKQTAAALEFYSKARHFVDLWEALAAELNEKKTFNAKLAKQVSKAFHDLEKSDGWPVGRPK